MVHTYDTIPAVGGVSVTGRPSGAMPDCYVDSGFVTPEGVPIFVPAEDMMRPQAKCSVTAAAYWFQRP